MLFMGTAFGGSRRDHAQQQRGFRKVNAGGPTATGGAGAAGAASAGPSGKVGFWRRQRLRGGRGSFGDAESQVRVKDEYA